MKLQFTVQQYQTDAVDAVVGCFAGQARQSSVGYRIDPGRRRAGELAIDAEAGLRNAEIALPPGRLLQNIQAVQRSRHLARSTELAASKAAPGAPNLTVEMETGTGKTYVYIKTIMELHKRYGWSKYIVVVPSVAIREGVKKTFDVTAEHFQEQYGTKPRVFVYNSLQLHELERFSSDAGVQVMIINIQAFNAAADAEAKAQAGKHASDDARRIFRELDDFQSRKPIDVIAANRPIVIIDEPQRLGEEFDVKKGKAKRPSKSLAALAAFKPLMVLRYSATHKPFHEYNKVHRLDALDAYNERLVKRIAVRGITVRGLAGTTAYLYVDSIQVARGAKPRARVEIQVQTATGVTRQMRWVDCGTNLHDLSNGIEAYKPTGQALFVRDIDAVRGAVELSDGETIHTGELNAPDATEESKRRIQIREVIAAHLAKERELFTQNIKVLSLFFIDEVKKYRDYDRDDTLGDYARAFEEEYRRAVADVLDELAVDDASARYHDYLRRHDVRDVHEGYFSIDKKGRQVDGKVAARGDDAGQSSDSSAYDLILKDKERLLSFDEPVRFVFSHSALREGWYNPNVFVMGMLKKSDNTVSRRQEIGRGLRLAVDQAGERVDAAAVGDRVHDINELTVVTDESYTSFVAGLQQEISETLAARPRAATVEFFTGKTYVVPTEGDTDAGRTVAISEDQAKQLQHWLIKNDFVDYDNHLTDRWIDRAQLPEMPEMPAGLEPFHYQIAQIIDALNVEIPVRNASRLESVPFNRPNFERAEFQALWNRINHKAVYQVDFDSAELVTAAVEALDRELSVAPLQYVVQTGRQRTDLDADDLQTGAGFTTTKTSTETDTVTAASTVQYDLLGEITEKTRLTRRTAAAILQGVNPAIFAKYRQNPEQFITETARIVNECKGTVIVEHLSYDTLDERFDTAIFTDNQVKQDLTKLGPRLHKHVYDYVITDSAGERTFVGELDTSTEVAVYAKLPRGFFIPTPVGDYNPDWAIAFHEGAVTHVYFVAETKGSLRSLDLRGVEDIKIKAARRFFEALQRRDGGGVVYEKVASYGDLMQKVMGA